MLSELAAVREIEPGWLTGYYCNNEILHIILLVCKRQTPSLSSQVTELVFQDQIGQTTYGNRTVTVKANCAVPSGAGATQNHCGFQCFVSHFVLLFHLPSSCCRYRKCCWHPVWRGQWTICSWGHLRTSLPRWLYQVTPLGTLSTRCFAIVWA